LVGKVVLISWVNAMAQARTIKQLKVDEQSIRHANKMISWLPIHLDSMRSCMVRVDSGQMPRSMLVHVDILKPRYSMFAELTLLCSALFYVVHGDPASETRSMPGMYT
jgi:hypothetical protein